VSNEPEATDAGIELVLSGGARLRIRKGVDEETLRAVLAAVEPEGCLSFPAANSRSTSAPSPATCGARSMVVDDGGTCHRGNPFSGHCWCSVTGAVTG